MVSFSPVIFPPRLSPTVAVLACFFSVVAVSGTFIDDNPSIKSGAEVEFIANIEAGKYGEELATIECDGFFIKLEGEEFVRSRPRVEFVTDAVSLNQPRTMNKMYTTLGAVADHMKSNDLEDFVAPGCTVLIPKAKAKKVKELRLESMNSVQVGVGLPLLFFENHMQQKFKEGGEFRDLWKMLNMNEVNMDKKNRSPRKSISVLSVGKDFRKFLCNDKKVFSNTGGEPGEMSKDDHPLLPKIDTDFNDSSDLCRLLAQGFDKKRCDIGEGYSPHNFKCFQVETPAHNRLSGVGFVAESRAKNKIGHFKSCVSAFVYAGWRSTNGRRAFGSCLSDFTELIDSLWTAAQDYDITFP